jgi:hypothetical protein
MLVFVLVRVLDCQHVVVSTATTRFSKNSGLTRTPLDKRLHAQAIDDGGSAFHVRASGDRVVAARAVLVGPPSRQPRRC